LRRFCAPVCISRYAAAASWPRRRAAGSARAVYSHEAPLAWAILPGTVTAGSVQWLQTAGNPRIRSSPRAESACSPLGLGRAHCRPLRPASAQYCGCARRMMWLSWSWLLLSRCGSWFARGAMWPAAR